MEPYANFAFTIVIENVKNSYLLTEKLIDPILHKTIPIYWGGDTKNDFDSKGIISFQTLEQLREILHDISFEKYKELRNPVSINQAKAINLLSKEINIEKSIRKSISLGSAENFDYSKSNVRDFLSGKSPLQSLGELGDFAVTTMSSFPGVDIETDTFSRLKFSRLLAPNPYVTAVTVTNLAVFAMRTTNGKRLVAISAGRISLIRSSKQRRQELK